MDDYDYEAEYNDFDTKDFADLGNTSDYEWGGSSGGFSDFQTPQSNNSGGYDFNKEMQDWDSQEFGDLGNTSSYQPSYGQSTQPQYAFGQTQKPEQSLAGWANQGTNKLLGGSYGRDASGNLVWKNTDGGGYSVAPDSPAGQQYANTDFGYNSGGGGFNPMDLLAKLFGGSGGGGSSGGGTNSNSRGVGSVLQDLISGNGNGIDNIGNLVSRILPFFAANEERKSADEYRKLAEDQLKDSRAYMDPFASERRQYMDRLLGASDRLEGIYNSPSSSAMYQRAKNEMERRVPRQLSKNRMSMGVNRMMAQQSPELMKAALADARDTMKSYITPAGADIKPNDMAGVMKAVLDAQKGSLTNPMWSAGAQFLQGNQNNNTQDQILNYLLKAAGKA